LRIVCIIFYMGVSSGRAISNHGHVMRRRTDI
jgi:hypothetical protein